MSQRKTIPVWAMVVLSLLPVWLFMYVLALKPDAKSGGSTEANGANVYAGNCSFCHGDKGQGTGPAYGFTNGSVLATFPKIEDQLRWVSLGTKAYVDAGVTVYGDANREGGARVTGDKGRLMPGWTASGLSDTQVLEVVCYERYELGGADKVGEYADEYALWCASDSPIYQAFQQGTADFDNVDTAFADKGIEKIGRVPTQ